MIVAVFGNPIQSASIVFVSRQSSSGDAATGLRTRHWRFYHDNSDIEVRSVASCWKQLPSQVKCAHFADTVDSIRHLQVFLEGRILLKVDL